MRRVSIAVFVLIALSAPLGADERVAALIEEELARDGVGGLSVGIIHRDELVYTAGFGLADMDAGTPATPEHVYRIGSITKQFTGFALLKLAHEEALAVTAPVERFVPEIERINDRFEDAPPITLIQLASMTSGLSREPSNLPVYLEGPASDWSSVVLRALAEVRFDFPPDTRYQYSNIGYAILGLAIERALEPAGTDYMGYVRDAFFEPLGMGDTDFVPRDRFAARIATGYHVEDGEIDADTPAREHRGRGYKVPNGAVYSTVADLARFISFQLGHGPDSVIPRNVLADNFDRSNSADGTLSSGYGIGFRVVRRGELVVFGHGGSVAGYRAGAYFDRASGKGVVLLRNVTGGSLDVTELAMRILELVS